MPRSYHEQLAIDRQQMMQEEYQNSFDQRGDFNQETYDQRVMSRMQEAGDDDGIAHYQNIIQGREAQKKMKAQYDIATQKAVEERNREGLVFLGGLAEGIKKSYDDLRKQGYDEAAANSAVQPYYRSRFARFANELGVPPESDTFNWNDLNAAINIKNGILSEPAKEVKHTGSGGGASAGRLTESERTVKEVMSSINKDFAPRYKAIDDSFVSEEKKVTARKQLDMERAQRYQDAGANLDTDKEAQRIFNLRTTSAGLQPKQTRQSSQHRASTGKIKITDKSKLKPAQ